MYQKSTLDNGLRIVTAPLKERESVGLGFWAGAGGRYEDDPIRGAAHFLEHILFKGSQKYSCAQIKEKIEGVGGSLNAFTAEEKTCYHAKTPAQHLTMTFEVLADMVLHPAIPPKEVEKEKGVILEEIKMYRDQPQYFVLDLLDELMWPGHPLGKNLIGTPETISRMTKDQLKAFHQQYYVPANMVVSACGQIDHRQLVRLAEKEFGRLTPGAKHEFSKVDNSQRSPRVKFYRKDIEQMQVALGMLGLEDSNEDKYILYLLHIILGGNMSSRLFNEVREKKGLAYSISTAVRTLHDTGMFLVRAGVDNKKVAQALELILKEFQKVRRHGVSQGEFDRAKDYYLGQIVLGLEDTLEHMLWIGDSLLGRDYVRTIEDVINRIKRIKRHDIQSMAQRILRHQRFNLAVVGPVTTAQKKELSSLLNV